MPELSWAWWSSLPPVARTSGGLEVNASWPRAIATAPVPSAFTQTDLMLMGATVRALETAGSLEAVLALSTQYSQERVAFERETGDDARPDRRQ